MHQLRGTKPDETTRERLLLCGARLFAQKGYAAASLRAVTSAAGANLAAIKYYFGDKAAFYQACFRHIWSLNASPLDAVDRAALRTRADCEEALRRVLEATATTILSDQPRNRCLCAMMTREMINPTPALRTIIREFIRPRLESFEALLGMWTGRKLNPAAMRLLSFTLLGQLMMFCLTQPVVRNIFGNVYGNPRFAKRLAEQVMANFAAVLNGSRTEAAAR
jgi:AcrR family transcriptional regulator